MVAKLSNIGEVRKALYESQGKPVELEDDQTQKVYVLVPREDFQKNYQATYDESEADPKEFYPLVDESFSGSHGWDAPGMELYDDYDKNRSQS
jgi:hypothetical protein